MALRLPTRAPTDPYVRALAHTVPQRTASPSPRRGVPAVIRTSYGDMQSNLDVFDMIPSVESVRRRFASLHRVLQGEFPCFHGIIKTLRLPAALLAALRCLRLAIPRSHSLVSLPGGRVHRRGLELVTRSPHRDCSRRRQDLPSSWGTPMFRLPCSHPTPAGRWHQTISVPRRGPRYENSEGSHERSFEAQ